MTDKIHRPIVICTAGHIDHGKSSLVLSLTGAHPDTQSGETSREISADLGFAKYGSEVVIVDIPGHEKFIQTTLTGVSMADAALLVVAADDGVMAQTAEHFEALKLLGVKTGVIALTKIDLAEKDWIELVRRDIRALVAGSSLQAVAIVPVSNRSGEGIVELKQELDLMIRGVTQRRDRGLLRILVDHSASLKGSGTVVAGTVLSGQIRLGDRIEILPGMIHSRVKGMEIRQQDAEIAHIGQRVTLSLPGVNKDIVQQGDMVATPEHFKPTFMINAKLNLLQSASRQLEDRSRARIHLGSSEYACRVALLDRAMIPPGGTGYVQLRFDEPAIADLSDRFVLRSISEGRLIGGGVVLEVHPPKMKAVASDATARLALLETPQPIELIQQLVRRKGLSGCDAMAIARETSLLESEARDVLALLHRDGEIFQIAPDPIWSVLDRRAWNHLRERVVAWLSEYHSALPQMIGARRSETKAKTAPSASAMVLDRVIEALVEDGVVALEGDLIRLASHRTPLDNAHVDLKTQIADIYRKSRFVPPDPKQLALELGITTIEVGEILTGLINDGQIVKLVDPDGGAVYYSKDAVDEARRILIELLTQQSELRFFEYREKLGSTRRYTTPLLMLFDSEGISIRDDDVRRKGSAYQTSSFT